MSSSAFKSLVVLLCVALASAVPYQAPASVCMPVSFNLTATAQNNIYSTTPNPNNENDILAYIAAVFSGSVVQTTGVETVTGTYTINGVYCRPRTSVDPHGSVLEVLVHGITYNKEMWAGLNVEAGEEYNWHSFANRRGYHTLAIDRLGHGTNPERPDPFSVVEGPFQVEIMHQLITLLRTGSDNPLGRTFRRIAYVGHSYGSFLGTALARLYPTDIDALVLTGYSTSVAFDIVHSLQLASAANVSPQRFSGTALGYVTTSQAAQRTAAFYAGAFDQRVAQADFDSEDTVTDGEVVGLGDIIRPAVGYANAVLIVTGVQDAIFCTPPVTECNGVLARSQQFFPNATTFRYKAIENTGHVLTLHHTAPATFARVHEFLDDIC